MHSYFRIDYLHYPFWRFTILIIWAFFFTTYIRNCAKYATRPALDILSEFNFLSYFNVQFTAAFHILLDHFLRHSKRKPEINHILTGPGRILAEVFSEIMESMHHFFMKWTIKYLLSVLRTNASLFCICWFFLCWSWCLKVWTQQITDLELELPSSEVA